MTLILALFGFGIGALLLFLGIMCAILTLALRILTAILWIIVKIVEHRSATRATEGGILWATGRGRPKQVLCKRTKDTRRPT
jgi:hypothetical protein